MSCFALLVIATSDGICTLGHVWEHMRIPQAYPFFFVWGAVGFNHSPFGPQISEKCGFFFFLIFFSISVESYGLHIFAEHFGIFFFHGIEFLRILRMYSREWLKLKEQS